MCLVGRVLLFQDLSIQKSLPGDTKFKNYDKNPHETEDFLKVCNSWVPATDIQLILVLILQYFRFQRTKFFLSFKEFIITCEISQIPSMMQMQWKLTRKVLIILQSRYYLLLFNAILFRKNCRHKNSLLKVAAHHKWILKTSKTILKTGSIAFCLYDTIS